MTKLKWSTKTPSSGWWFQRWKDDRNHWFVVEITCGVVTGSGIQTVEIEDARSHGAQWAGPIMLPKHLK